MKRILNLILFSYLILTFPTQSFAIEIIEMSRSTAIQLELRPGDYITFQLKNFHIPSQANVWNYYCIFHPTHDRVFIYNVKKNGPTTNPILTPTSSQRFDYVITRDEAAWQTINFDVYYKGTVPFQTTLFCWINGDLNPVQIDKLYLSAPATATTLSSPSSNANSLALNTISKTPTPVAQKAPSQQPYSLNLSNNEDILLLQIKVASLQNIATDPQAIQDIKEEINKLKTILSKANNIQARDLQELEDLLAILSALPTGNAHVNVVANPETVPIPKIPTFHWNKFPMLLNLKGVPFIEPVVIAKNGPPHLIGKTMEKEEAEILKESSYSNLIYYPNLALAHIIVIFNTFNSFNDAAVKHLNDTINDPFDLEVMTNPYIFDEGQSISKTTMTDLAKGALNIKNIITRKTVEVSSLVPNHNLDEFIKAYIAILKQ